MTKKILFSIILFVSLAPATIFSQLLVENFNYPAGDSLTSHGWVSHSGGTTAAIVVGTPGLEFPGYVVTGGNNALLYNNGQDVNKTFDSVLAGPVYASFLVKYTALPVTGYFFHLGAKTIGTAFRARVWAKPDLDGTHFNFGLSHSSSDSIYSPVKFCIDSTYLVVAKYEVVAGADNDFVKLYVFAYGENIATEPATPLVGPLTIAAADLFPGAIALRQYNAAERIIVDNIQVSTTWMLSIVPVELTSFTASVVGSAVNLNWTTATEVNNSGFDIERFSNNTWQKIGFVKGNGTSTSTQNYCYIDNYSSNGNISYRLKQVDFDGTSIYSNVVEVEFSPSVFALEQNYPNPFNPSTSIKFTVAESGIAVLKIFNVLGEEVASLFNQSVEKGTIYNVNFNASNLNSGVYFAQLTQGSNVKNIKLILNK